MKRDPHCPIPGDPCLYKFVSTCDECLSEAWERMTQGGINGRNAISMPEWQMHVGRPILYSSWLIGLDL